MAYRWKPKYAEVDAESPKAWATCSRCGFIWNLNKLLWQYDYRGSTTPQNTFVLVCPRCYDEPQPQLAPQILPPDPPPIFNARPENYTVDETSWLTTQDDEIIVTQSDVPVITSIPNPGDNANTTYLTSVLPYPGELTVAYFDIFDGDPLNGGVSVLEAITGSATRTNIFSSLALTDDESAYTNPAVLVISAASESITNVSYIGIYDAATDGELLASGRVGATYPPTVIEGAAVQFNALGFVIETTPEVEMEWGAYLLLWGSDQLVWGEGASEFS